MIYFFHGNDVQTIRAKKHSLIASLVAKKPDVSILKAGKEDFSEEFLKQISNTQGLFENIYIVSLHNVFDLGLLNIDNPYLGELQKSKHIVVWSEENFDETELSDIERFAQKIQKYNDKGNVKKEVVNPNLFNFAEDVFVKNTKESWVQYAKLIRDGFGANDLINVLTWQIKVVNQTEGISNPQESGLKPFVFKKGKNIADRYSKKELRKMLIDLTSLAQEMRMSDREDLLLEKWLLEK
jgi:DNA polymerase III delta subunit